MTVQHIFILIVVISAVLSTLKIFSIAYKGKISEGVFVLWIMYNTAIHFIIASFFF